jgi:dienelactone hydrolase
MRAMPTRLSRRQLALGSAAAASLAAGAAALPEDAALDPVLWTRLRCDKAPLRLAFRATKRRDAETWQRQLRGKLTELLGGFPAERTPLAPETLEKREFASYTRERVLFTSRPGVKVSAWLLTPKASSPHAAMICVPGHGRGADDIVAIDEKGLDRVPGAGYQRDFAVQMVERGVATIAIEPMGFGCRRDPITKKRGAGTAACQPAAGAALLFGETMIGWRVYDIMRTIDWIATRPELDASRVGCMGISGGGTATVFTTALEPRISVALVSGYLNTFRDSILSLSHCIDNYVPGILNWAEMYDIAGLIAPRPLFIESGTRDPIFPIAATRDSIARVQRIYDVFASSDALGHEIFEGEHVFHGEKGIPFVVERLRRIQGRAPMTGGRRAAEDYGYETRRDSFLTAGRNGQRGRFPS